MQDNQHEKGKTVEGSVEALQPLQRDFRVVTCSSRLRRRCCTLPAVIVFWESGFARFFLWHELVLEHLQSPFHFASTFESLRAALGEYKALDLAQKLTQNSIAQSLFEADKSGVVDSLQRTGGGIGSDPMLSLAGEVAGAHGWLPANHRFRFLNCKHSTPYAFSGSSE
ncbi:MAG: hypothetical protein V4710_16520 [Verrucomicrobiota bacterium]